MTRRTDMRLRAAMAALVAVDVVGGVLAVATGVNTWGEAWSGNALLAAPAPMVAVQVVLTWIASTRTGRGAVASAALLSVACLVSVASGFFDGGLGHGDLGPGQVAFQVLLLAVTTVVGLLAAARTRHLLVGSRSTSGTQTLVS